MRFGGEGVVSINIRFIFGEDIQDSWKGNNIFVLFFMQSLKTPVSCLKDLQELLIAIEYESCNLKLRLNEMKIKWMVVDKDRNNLHNLLILTTM